MNKDFIKTIQDAVSRASLAECADAGQMTLGELVARLEAMPAKSRVVSDTSRTPGQAMSYRGYYEMLAFSDDEDPVTVGEFLAEAKSAIGQEFYGYKGGEYTMTRMTPVFLADYGCMGRRITGVRFDAETQTAVLMTCDDD